MIHHTVPGNGGTIVARDVEVTTPLSDLRIVAFNDAEHTWDFDHPRPQRRAKIALRSSPSAISGGFWMAMRPGQIHVLWSLVRFS